MNLHTVACWLLGAAWLFAGCAEDPVPDNADKLVRVPFSLSVGRASDAGPATKMSASIVQNSNPVVFRGIERLYVIPFNADGAVVTEGDSRWAQNVSLPQIGIPANTFGSDANGGSFEGLVSNSNSHLYDQVYLRVQTNSVLVYGKAPDQQVAVAETDSVAFKQRNGVLRPQADLDYLVSADEIAFDLAPVIPEWKRTTYQTWRNDLLNYLNAITNVNKSKNSVKYSFNQPATYNNHPELSAAFYEFISEGKMFSLSDKVLSYKLTRLFRAVYPYIDKHNSVDYVDKKVNYYYVSELAKEVCNKIQNTKFVTVNGSGTSASIVVNRTAPSCFGLPDGTEPVLWREGSRAFGILETYSGLLAVPFEYFYFPPSLWYYVNSPVYSTKDASVVDSYKSVQGGSTPVTWDDISGQYSSLSVIGDAVAAAVRDPVQYGVGLMTLQVKQSPYSTLTDAKGKNVAVNNKNFPLTGIVLADQRPVGFDFTPRYTSPTRYVYDPEVLDGTTPLAYLSSNSNVSKPVSMLVLQTLDGQPVHFALEFSNAGGGSFSAADGTVIYPGCRFYLIGVLKMEYATNTTGETLPSVFARDHKTIVNASITSLANCYGVLPSLDDPQLLVGVTAHLAWDVTAPETIPLQ